MKKRLLACFICCALAGLAHAEMAPNWQLPTFSGKTVSLAQMRGQIVLIDFWASWCVPCRSSMPALLEIQQEFGAEHVRVLPISVDESREDAREFLQKYAPSLDSAWDTEGRVAAAYDLLGMPSSFIVSAQGEIVLRHEGFRKGDKDVWVQSIRGLLSAQQ